MPAGFEFPEECTARDLPSFHYFTFAPPTGLYKESEGVPRVWPLDGILGCSADEPNHTASIQIYGSMINGRLYGFEIDVLNPRMWNVLWSNETWLMKLVIMDNERYARDGTYTTCDFNPWVPNENISWSVYRQPLNEPIGVNVASQRFLKPSDWTNVVAELIVFPLRLNITVFAALRITAPDGYVWYPSLAWYEDDGDAPWPGGRPEEPTDPDRLFVLEWPDGYVFEDNTTYGFRTRVRMPQAPPRKSANAFFFEWGYNETFTGEDGLGFEDFGRVVAERVEAPMVRALRNAKVEASTTLAGERSTVWIRISTVTNISVNGSLEVQLPYGYVFDNYTVDDYELYGAYMGQFCHVAAVMDFGSDPSPNDLSCRTVIFPAGISGAELRIELSSNETGIPAGNYYFEFNVTNPPLAEDNPLDPSSSCGRKFCVNMFSMVERYDSMWSLHAGQLSWVSPDSPYSTLFEEQNDYWTSIPALRLTTRMKKAEIANLTFFERLQIGNNDRPYARSARVFAFMLDTYVPRADDALHIRAPPGWIFDGYCEVFVNDMVYPGPRPRTVHRMNSSDENETGVPVARWPASAYPISCRGDGYEATIRLGAGIKPQNLYLFRITIRSNPVKTPLRNTWQITYGGESSGEIPGFPVWTFPRAFMDPISLSHTDANNRLSTPISFQFHVTNDLLGSLTILVERDLLTGIEIRRFWLEPIIRLVMPTRFEIMVDHTDQLYQGGNCIAVIMQLGFCRLCGIPFDTATYSCRREWNRRNAAILRFNGDVSLEVDKEYRISIYVFNPRIVDSLQSSPRDFVMESFLGQPVPPARWPRGYALDYVDIEGFKISEKGRLTISEPSDRNGSAFVYDNYVTVRFTGLLKPGDRIMLRSPPNYKTSEPVFGLVISYRCVQFEWMHMVWPDTPELDSENGRLTQPPVRLPVPPRYPPWGRGGAKVFLVPLFVNISNNTHHCFHLQNATLPFVHQVDCAHVNMLVNETVNLTLDADANALLREAQMPEWAIGAALLAHEEAVADRENRTQFLVMRQHCMSRSINANQTHFTNATNSSSNFSDANTRMPLSPAFNWSHPPWGTVLAFRIEYTYDELNETFVNCSNVTGFNETFHYTNNYTNCTTNWRTVEICTSADDSDDNASNGTNCSSAMQPSVACENVTNFTISRSYFNITTCVNVTVRVTNVTKLENATNVTRYTWLCLRARWREVDTCEALCNCNGSSTTNDLQCPVWPNCSHASAQSVANDSNRTHNVCNDTAFWTNSSNKTSQGTNHSNTNTTCFRGCLAMLSELEAEICSEVPRDEVAEGVTPIAFNVVPVPSCPINFTHNSVLVNVTVCNDTNVSASAGMNKSSYSGLLHNNSSVNGTHCRNVSTETNITDTTNYTCGCFCCEGAALVEVLWRTAANLSSDMRSYELAHQEALALRRWDLDPIQAEPHCDDEYVTWDITEENSHPDPRLRNGTTIAFKLGFQNPRRPPLEHENFWIVRHYSAGQVSSSDAIPGWPIISKLRYVRIELLNEVLRENESADIHIEFVTVNPAQTIIINAIFPTTWNFGRTFVSSPETDQLYSKTDDRRLLTEPHWEDSINSSNASARVVQRRLGWPYTWKGFTSEIVAVRGDGPTLELKANLQRAEYTRLRLSGVVLPWNGGQASLSLFTSIRGIPQDRIEECCLPGMPLENPAVVFHVPHRLRNFEATIMNQYQQRPAQYPILYFWGTRYGESCEVTMEFSLPASHFPSGGDVIFVIRAPLGYTMLNSTFEVQDASVCGKEQEVTEEGSRGGCTFTIIPSVKRMWTPRRVHLGLPYTVSLPADAKYRIGFSAATPANLTLIASTESHDSLWVAEVTDQRALESGIASRNLGSFPQFKLLSQINFTVAADRSPPDVVVEIEIILRSIGGFAATIIDVYAPLGYSFLPGGCFAPNQPYITELFVSCRERLSLFGATYLSGALMMTVDNGVPKHKLPMSFRLLARTPPESPERNTWLLRGINRHGIVSWGTELVGFPVMPMEVTVAYATLSNSVVPLFVRLIVRFGLAWGGHVHIAAPRTYKIFCPVNKVLAGPLVPDCTHDDPVLTDCWNLPAVGDPPKLGFPPCDPMHEVLLSFNAVSNSTASQFAVDPGTTLLFAMNTMVPAETPRPRSDNVFRVQVLDPNRIPEDGRLNIYAAEVRKSPRVGGFKIWWTRAVPDTIVTVAIEFRFNGTIDRAGEDPSMRILVIEIVAPERLKMALRRPKDAQRLVHHNFVPVTSWNWTGDMPRQLWFGVDREKNVSGTFHYAFPVLTPGSDVGMPENNLWQVKLCADSPYCNRQILNVPIPGFSFGERPSFVLDLDAAVGSTGGSPRRAGSLVWFWLPWCWAASLFLDDMFWFV
eukprot:TRINITY_DN27739_c0_g1_i1.p1 TRINITY_DN27739_c0_g1~~TRINITY_DN27739_c0_g1_i1.p1  ORF type:complete len:2646 (-),score=257.87 TRINITY_DN27739_c0_g1_i1:120-7187(-)